MLSPEGMDIVNETYYNYSLTGPPDTDDIFNVMS